MNDYIIIAIIGAWIIILVTSISINQYTLRKKIQNEKTLTEAIDKLRKDAFIQHKDFNQTAKQRLWLNQVWWYTAHRWEMKLDVLHIRWEQIIEDIDKLYRQYEKTSTKARVTSVIANISSIGLYRILM